MQLAALVDRAPRRRELGTFVEFFLGDGNGCGMEEVCLLAYLLACELGWDMGWDGM